MFIAKVNVKSFRGIPNELTFDFTAGTNQLPHSLILFGDNGTGKSSIVDAIQFALQAQIGYKRNVKNVLFLAVESMPTVSVYLTNGKIIQRCIGKNYIQKEEEVLESFKLNDERRYKQFNIAPLVLRRADILRFLETPDEKRQIVFRDYRFRQETFEEDEPSSIVRDIEALEMQRLEKKKRRRDLVEKLAKRIAVEPNDIPLSLKDFDQFVRKKVYGGLSARERYCSRKDGIGAVPPQSHETIKEIRKLNEEIPKIGRELKTSRKSESRIASDLVLKELLADAGNRLTEAFHQIYNCNFVDKIEIACGDITVVSLSLKFHLNNGQVCLPHKLFSEANLDLLVLLLFLSLAKEAASRGQVKVLILDDVLQSVDATIRVAIANYILK